MQEFKSGMAEHVFHDENSTQYMHMEIKMGQEFFCYQTRNMSIGHKISSCVKSVKVSRASQIQALGILIQAF